MSWASASAVGSDLAALADKVVGEVLAGLAAARGAGGPAGVPATVGVPATAGARADVVLVAFGPDHAPRAAVLRDRLRAAFPRAALAGASALGVVGGGREHESAAGLSVLAGVLPGTEVRAVHVTQERLPSADAPPAAWHALLGVAPAARPSFLWVADPFSLRADALVGGVDFAYPGATSVGGLASGASGPGEQVLMVGDRLVRTGAVGLVLTGAVRLVPVVAQGCRGFGEVLRITSCTDNLLRTLDGEPALDVVHRVVREATEADRSLARATSFFLGIETDPFAAPSPDGPWLVRNFLGRERDGGGLFVGEMLRQGRRVRLHVRDRVSAASDLDAQLARAAAAAPQVEAAALFSCLGRGMGLYGVPDHDTRAFHAKFPGVAMGGFFCSGEIGPVGGTTHLHGFTSSFGLFVRDADAGPA